VSEPRILAIDDEPQIRRALVSVLRLGGYVVTTASSGEEGLVAAAEQSPGLIVLDLSLPDIDGVEVARRLRQWTAVPVLVLSARDADRDKIQALDAGADDYLTKPFSAGELLARVRALLRRSGPSAAAPAIVYIGDLEIDVARRRVVRAGEELHLTRTEFDILAFLVAHADRVVTSRMILEAVWGPEYAEDRQTLRVHVSHLRKKVEPHPSVPRYILTEPGVGFILRTA